MWKCPECGRIFDKQGQTHSCRRVPVEQHFRNKEVAQALFVQLQEALRSSIGECEVISLPCCIHLYGKYDFLAALPKKDRLEIRFALGRPLDSPRVKQSAQTSGRAYTNCTDIRSASEIDEELMEWLAEAYQMRGR